MGYNLVGSWDYDGPLEVYKFDCCGENVEVPYDHDFKFCPMCGEKAGD